MCVSMCVCVCVCVRVMLFIHAVNYLFSSILYAIDDTKDDSFCFHNCVGGGGAGNICLICQQFV